MAKKNIRPVSFPERVFFWLAGSGSETLSMTPDFERRKHSAFGATVLIPTVFGGLASGYLISTVTDRLHFIAIGSVIWALFILAIDRAMLASYRSCLPGGQKVFQFCLRFSIALLVGVAVAHPLVLVLFKDSVDEVHREVSIRVHDARIAELDAKVREEQKIISGLRDQLSGSFRNFDPLPMPVAPKSSDYEDQIAAIENEIQKQTADRIQLQSEIDRWEKARVAEIEGRGPSGLAGHGRESKRIEEDELEWRRARYRGVSKTIGILAERKALLIQSESEPDPAAQKLIAKKIEAQTKDLSEMMASQSTIRESIQSQIAASSDRLETYRVEMDIERRARAGGGEGATDIIAQTLALHSMIEEEGGKVVLAVYLLLSCIFVLLDTIPLVSKFSAKPGPYDALLKAEEAEWMESPAESSPAAVDLSRNPMEVALDVAKLKRRLPTNAKVADHLGVKPPQVSKYIKLTMMSGEFQEALRKCSHVTLEMAYMIANMDHEDCRVDLLEICEDRHFTQHQLKVAIAGLDNPDEGPDNLVQMLA